jgi:transcriptional regulator with XRE-family HTH domain
MAKRPPSKESKEIGLRMQKVLTVLGINQTEAAFRLGLSSQGVLSHYLTGRREVPVDIVKKFYKEFEVPLSTLMGDDDTGAIVKTEEDAVLTKIISVMDDWARKNAVVIKPEAKSRIMVHFCHSKGGSQKAIEAALVQAMADTPELFGKDKCSLIRK